MQRLQDAVRHFPLWVSGKVELQKWDALRAKFCDLYGTELEASAKSRRKKKGHAVATLIAYRDEKNDIVHWWLLATQGRGRVNQRETLFGVQDRRITAPGGYELVHDGTSWSWKYSETHVRKLREAIHIAIAGKHDDQVRSLVTALYSTAGFRIARTQAGKLVAFTRSEWKRIRRASEPLPQFPTAMAYVRRLPNVQQKTPPLATFKAAPAASASLQNVTLDIDQPPLLEGHGYDDLTEEIAKEWHASQDVP